MEVLVSYYVLLLLDTVETGIIGPLAKTFEIPSLGQGGERTAKSDLLRPSLRQKKKKKEPDHTNKGNSNVLESGPIIPVLTV